ncbi:hypothetical protein ACFL0V_03135 [Nanoarchaeota archaeon]
MGGLESFFDGVVVGVDCLGTLAGAFYKKAMTVGNLASRYGLKDSYKQMEEENPVMPASAKRSRSENCYASLGCVVGLATNALFGTPQLVSLVQNLASANTRRNKRIVRRDENAMDTYYAQMEHYTDVELEKVADPGFFKSAVYMFSAKRNKEVAARRVLIDRKIARYKRREA